MSDRVFARRITLAYLKHLKLGHVAPEYMELSANFVVRKRPAIWRVCEYDDEFVIHKFEKGVSNAIFTMRFKNINDAMYSGTKLWEIL